MFVPVQRFFMTRPNPTIPRHRSEAVRPGARQEIVSILSADPLRVSALRAVAILELPDAWLAAGFVRNAVWDARHGYPPTPLNDLDVIFFDAEDPDGDRARRTQEELMQRMPGLN